MAAVLIILIAVAGFETVRRVDDATAGNERWACCDFGTDCSFDAPKVLLYADRIAERGTVTFRGQSTKKARFYRDAGLHRYWVWRSDRAVNNAFFFTIDMQHRADYFSNAFSSEPYSCRRR